MYGCLDPKKVKVTGQNKEIYVKCGECEACKNARSSILANRISREVDNNTEYTQFCYLITMKYDNEHLPVYELKNKVRGIWYSNREGFPPLSGIKEYPRPIGHTSKYECFGHLAYIDTHKYLTQVRTKLYNAFKRNKKASEHDLNIVNTYFKDKTHEDIRFRYFICGEYGPATFRPHYHLLVWLKFKPTRQQSAILQQMFRSCWKNGFFDIVATSTDGYRNYVASYLNSTNHLPEVLRTKSIKPFCNFSKLPSIGAYTLTQDELRGLYTTGAYHYYKWDAKKKEFIDVPLECSFYRKYAPKCRGFSKLDDKEKLRVYDYVRAYFEKKGITHTPENVDAVKLCEVEWPVEAFPKKVFRKQWELKNIRTSFDGEWSPEVWEMVVDEWSYIDKYASMYAYKASIKLGWTIEQVLQGIIKVYTKQSSDMLGKFYDEQNERATQVNHNEYFVQLRYTINFDLDFLSNLPLSIHDLELYQIYALESYGFDIETLYPNEELDIGLRDSYSRDNDPYYIEYKRSHLDRYDRKVKKKEDNERKEYHDYVDSLDTNIHQVKNYREPNGKFIRTKKTEHESA